MISLIIIVKVYPVKEYESHCIQRQKVFFGSTPDDLDQIMKREHTEITGVLFICIFTNGFCSCHLGFFFVASAVTISIVTIT